MEELELEEDDDHKPPSGIDIPSPRTGDGLKLGFLFTEYSCGFGIGAIILTFEFGDVYVDTNPDSSPFPCHAKLLPPPLVSKEKFLPRLLQFVQSLLCNLLFDY